MDFAVSLALPSAPPARRRVHVVAALLLAVAWPAIAGATPEESKTLVLSVLERNATAFKDTGTTVSWGEPTVRATPEGDRVTVPDLRFEGPEKTFEPGPVEITLNDAPPVDGHKRTRVRIETAGKMRIAGKDGTVTDITIGSNELTGILADEYKSFLNVNFAYRDIAVTSQAAPDALRIGEVSLTTDLKENAGFLGGTGRFAVKRVAVTTPEIRMEIDEMVETVAADRVPMQASFAISEAVRGVLQPGDPPTVDPARLGALLDLLDATPSLLDKIGVDLGLAGLRVTGKDGTAFALGTYQVGLNYAVAGAENADLGLRLAIDGVTLPLPQFADLAPNRIGLKTTLVGVPRTRLWAALIEAARQGSAGAPEDAKNALLGQLMEIARTSDTRLAVEAAVGTTALAAQLRSDLKLDPDSGAGVVGTAMMTLIGLDPVIEKYRRAPKDPMTQQALTVLEMLKGLGASQVANNQITYAYDLRVEKEGTITLNGQDIQQLMNPQPPPQAPAPRGPRR